MNRRQTLLVLARFAAGVAAAVVIPPALDLVSQVIFQQRKEVQRLTSPDGAVDAVAENIDCGVHLLDVAYDRALILVFSNVAYPLAKPGNVESWHYGVEVHLSPSAPRFSYLPDTSAITSH